jgi:multiple antibiotic resistance protein
MLGTLADVVRAAMLTVAALLPLINPPGMAPIFLSMTPGASRETRTSMARNIAINSILLLVGAALIGSYVLTFFGLSIAAVRIAGGVLVSAAGWNLIRADAGSGSTLVGSSPAEWDLDRVVAHSFYPLTFPLTIGPGSISVALTLGANARAHEVEEFTAVAGTFVGIIMVVTIVYYCYRFASNVLRVLGPTGTTVLLRLSAFILLAVGVQILCDGLGERFAFLQGR